VQDFTSLYPSPENFVSTSGHHSHQYCSAVALYALLTTGIAADATAVV
jgi:hypothetical protein